MNLTRRDALSLGLLGTLALSSCKEKERGGSFLGREGLKLRRSSMDI